MPISQPTFRPGNIVVTGAPNPRITNLVLTNANTEYSHNLQTNLNQLIIKARGNSTLKLAFISGDSGTTYITIPNKACLNVSNIGFTGATLYIQSSANNEVAEILELY